MIQKYNVTESAQTFEGLEESERDEIKHLQREYGKQLEDEDNYFTCCICLKILLEPKECNKCQSAFCKECINEWKTNGENSS